MIRSSFVAKSTAVSAKSKSHLSTTGRNQEKVAEQIGHAFSYTHAIEAAALLVALLGLLNTLLISVMERTKS